MSSWRSARSGFIYVACIVCVPFRFGVWERIRNWIVLVPECCLFIIKTTFYCLECTFSISVLEYKDAVSK